MPVSLRDDAATERFGMTEHRGPISDTSWGRLQVQMDEDGRYTVLPWRTRQTTAAQKTPFISLECLDSTLVRVDVTPDGLYLASCFDFPYLQWLSDRDAYDAVIMLMVNIEEFLVAWNTRMMLNSDNDPHAKRRYIGWSKEKAAAIEKAKWPLPPPRIDDFRRRMLRLAPTPEEQAEIEKQG